MTQIVINHVMTVPDQADMYLTGLMDMVMAQTGQGPVLYTVSRFGGGDLVAFRINSDGTLTRIDTQPMPGGGHAGSDHHLHLTDDGTLLVTGVNYTGLYRVALDAQGHMSQPEPVTGAPMPANLLASTSMTIGEDTYLFGVDRGSTEIGVWREAPDGTVTSVQASIGGNSSAVGLTDLTQVDIDGATILLAASGADNALISYRLDAQNVPQEVARLGAADGVGIGGASAVEVITVGGQSFALLAASGSGTVTVAQIAQDGTLAVTDHVMDTLNTRFAGAHDIASATHEGRAYIAVAGSDDGVSLFELMPGGRLRLMGSVEDAANTTLDAVSALALSVLNGVLHLSVGSASEAGLTAFTVDISAMASPMQGTGASDDLVGGGGADLILGHAGDDALRGGAGDDVLLDGAGSDEMWGGTGADVFVLSGDGASDTIHDFDITMDRLDLSDWAFLRNVGQLTFDALSDGLILRFGTEELVIHTVDGEPLDADDFFAIDILGQSRFLPGWVPPDIAPQPDPDPDPDPDPAPDPGDPLNLVGTNGQDTLTGQGGNDVLRGLNDADNLVGMGGADTIDGDGGNDTLTGNAGNDSLNGGAGNDTLSGGTGTDTLNGDIGNDTVSGAGGDDWIYGGSGHDTLTGNAGNDRIWGQDGNDQISGGIGFDTINGDDGADTISGNDGFDVIGGGGGDDRLNGNNGADSIYGDGGNDTIDGGLANDFLAGGNGHDVISGAAGPDELRGNAGDDVLSGNAGADLLSGGLNDDTLHGGINHDTLFGGDGRDRLNGNNGRDQLYGDAGNDTLAGNAGPDTLNGGSGDDLLLGGIGADTFVFASGSDTIADFQNEIDTLVLDPTLWGGGTRTVAELGAFASVTDDGLVLDFGDGQILTLQGLNSLNVLNNDLDFL